MPARRRRPRRPRPHRAGAGTAATSATCRCPPSSATAGASGYRPEHTLGSYQFALDNGADVIEQDVVPTKDGHLVCRHENDITGTTDVSSRPEFASRKTTKTVDGEAHTGWFTEDFTLAELRRCAPRSACRSSASTTPCTTAAGPCPPSRRSSSGADEQGRKRGRRVWLHVETKHPTYFRKLGLGLEERLAKLLRRYGRSGRDGHTFLQSFEPSSLQRLGRLGVAGPKILLLDDLPVRPWDFVEAKDPRTTADLVTPKGLKWVAGFADGIGPGSTRSSPGTRTQAHQAHHAGARRPRAGLILPPVHHAQREQLPARRLPSRHRPGRVRRRLRRLQDVLRHRDRRHLLGQLRHRGAGAGRVPGGTQGLTRQLTTVADTEG
ncbi:glycerophosphodiester phosphodiesterase family protein [Streptomyces thioluteus]|uniref:glycerophosphodiester phosphodiesterase family protein n=1 Tax=Streptomyces thioluteus TaxID=66431 RepID=UPI0031EF8D98